MTPIEMVLMSPAPVTALAAILGSVTGALGCSLSTWIAQRHQDRRDLLAKKIFHREELCSDFITESARLLIDALEHSVSDPKSLIPAYALLSRIRLSSSPDVLATSEEVVRDIIRTYSKANLMPEEVRLGAASGENPL
jgi:hypothetical protein